MQFRFREWNKEENKYNLVTIMDVEDYDTMFRTLDYMATNKCECPLEYNEENLVEANCNLYIVKAVSLCVGDFRHPDEVVLPHFVVDIEEY